MILCSSPWAGPLVSRKSGMAKIRTKLTIGILGLVFLPVLLELALRLGGFSIALKIFSGQRSADQSARPVSILVVGDSCTLAGLLDRESTYPSYLQEEFSEKYPSKFVVYNGTICNANSTQIRRQLSDLVKDYSIDRVILRVGAANRFNFVGYHHDWIKSILADMRLLHMARIMMVSLKKKVFKEELKSNLRERLRMFQEYHWGEHRGIGKKDYFCKNVEKSKLRMAIDRENKKHEHYDRLADCYVREDRLQKAEEAYKMMVENNLDFASYGYLGHFYAKHRMYEKAEEIYKEALTKHPDAARGYLELGRIYVKQGKHEEAKTLYDSVQASGPARIAVYEGLGEYYVSLGKYDDASQAFRKVVEMNSRYMLWAEIYKANTIGCVERNRQKDTAGGAPDEPFYVDLNDYEPLVGRYAPATEEFKSAVAGYAKMIDAKELSELAELYIQQDNYFKSLDILFEAIENWPRESDYYYLAKSYYYDLAKSSYYYLGKSFELQDKHNAEFILNFLKKVKEDNSELAKNEILQDYIASYRDQSRRQDVLNDWLRQDLDEIARLCLDNDIDLIIQNYPYPYHAVNRILKEVAVKHDLPFVDNYGVFKELTPYVEYFIDPDHNTPEGHKVVTDNIYSVLMTK